MTHSFPTRRSSDLLINEEPFDRYIESQAGALAARDMGAMKELIHHCARLHLDHISGAGDPFEKGSSRPLDFGHWSAHKLEQMSDYQLRHGEAVVIGMALDVVYSTLKGLLPQEDGRSEEHTSELQSLMRISY